MPTTHKKPARAVRVPRDAGDLPVRAGAGAHVPHQAPQVPRALLAYRGGGWATEVTG